MKPTALVHRQRILALALVISCAASAIYAQNEPILVPDVVDYAKLVPILPEAPQGWIAEKPEGSTEDVGGFRITNVHRDYHKGEGDKAKPVKVTASQSRLTAILVSRHSKRKVNTPLFG